MTHPEEHRIAEVLTPEVLAAIQEDLDKWDAGSTIRAHAEANREKWEKIMEPLHTAIFASSRLTEKDYRTTVNYIED